MSNGDNGKSRNKIDGLPNAGGRRKLRGTDIISAILIFFLVAAVAFFLRDKKALFGSFDNLLAAKPKTSEKTIVSDGSGSFKTVINNEGEVSVEVTPIALSPTAIGFNVRLDTHSVDLDFDLRKKAVLRTETGEEVEPLSWSGGRGGHHLSGTLNFPPQGEIKAVRLIIYDLAAIKERLFEWEL